MDEVLDYRFNDFDTMNAAVRTRLADFNSTLQEFKRAYGEMADNWGGAAAENAGDVALRLDRFGRDTATLVGRFLKELEQHLEQSRATELANKNLFTG